MSSPKIMEKCEKLTSAKPAVTSGSKSGTSGLKTDSKIKTATKTDSKIKTNTKTAEISPVKKPTSVVVESTKHSQYRKSVISFPKMKDIEVQDKMDAVNESALVTNYLSAIKNRTFTQKSLISPASVIRSPKGAASVVSVDKDPSYDGVSISQRKKEVFTEHKRQSRSRTIGIILVSSILLILISAGVIIFIIFFIPTNGRTTSTTSENSFNLTISSKGYG